MTAIRLTISLGLFLVLPALPGLAADPKPEQVAPGVWRLHFGSPEKLTPLSFRTAPPLLEGFDALPDPTMPLDVSRISFSAMGHGCSVGLPMTREERIYGFGLNTRLFEMTSESDAFQPGAPDRSHPGRHVFLRPTDAPENDLNDSHAPVPFYVSTRGYGIYVDTARYASFYTGNVAPKTRGKPAEAEMKGGLSTDDLYKARELSTKTMLVDVPAASGIDVYIFGGPTLGDAVRRYNLFSGGGAVPPLWGLGIQYRGFAKNTAADSLALAKSIRDSQVPIDCWGLEPGWQSKAYSCSFVWNKHAFPDPDGFIRQMLEMGYQVNTWEHCFTNPESPIFEALKPWSGDYLVWNGLVPDFATPEGRRIFGDLHDASIFSKGVTSVKLDECDNQPSSAKPWSFPEASAFPSGLDGEQMHSLLGILYQQTIYERLRKMNVRTWGLVRNSGALAAPLPFSLYSDSYNDRSFALGLVKQGFSGLLWTPEVRDAKTIEEYYRRLELVIFSPVALINGWYMKLPPWLQIDRDKSNRGELMADHEEVTRITRKICDLRMSLIPYLYSAFNEYRLHGMPPMRALVMDWPEDKETFDLADEFMVGPSLLVAPIFNGQSSRKVYLPAGNWFDFYTHEKIAGGRGIEVRKALDEIPLYVKENSLLPLAKPVDHVQPDICFELEVSVFGEKPAAFTLYEDDGLTYDFEHGAQNRIVLNWGGSAGSEEKTGSYKGASRYRVSNWKIAKPSTTSP
jgi:alpha-D-xyloside xylohydrolase